MDTHKKQATPLHKHQAHGSRAMDVLPSITMQHSPGAREGSIPAVSLVSWPARIAQPKSIPSCAGKPRHNVQGKFSAVSHPLKSDQRWRSQLFQPLIGLAKAADKSPVSAVSLGVGDHTLGNHETVPCAQKRIKVLSHHGEPGKLSCAQMPSLQQIWSCSILFCQALCEQRGHHAPSQGSRVPKASRRLQTSCRRRQNEDVLSAARKDRVNDEPSFCCPSCVGWGQSGHFWHPKSSACSAGQHMLPTHVLLPCPLRQLGAQPSPGRVCSADGIWKCCRDTWRYAHAHCWEKHATGMRKRQIYEEKLWFWWKRTVLHKRNVLQGYANFHFDGTFFFLNLNDLIKSSENCNKISVLADLHFNSFLSNFPHFLNNERRCQNVFFS